MCRAEISQTPSPTCHFSEYLHYLALQKEDPTEPLSFSQWHASRDKEKPFPPIPSIPDTRNFFTG